MEFNDGNQWHYVTDLAAHLRAGRTMYEMRACSAVNDGRDMYVDTRYHQQRNLVQPAMVCFMQYQFPYRLAGSARQQCQFLLRATGPFRDNEVAMCDVEWADGDGIPPDRSLDFFREWCCGTLYPETGTHAVCYVPEMYSAYLNFRTLGPEHLIKGPRYPRNNPPDVWGPTPDWDHNIHQVGQNNYFPGGNGRGDLNFTVLTAEQILAHCRGDQSPQYPTLRKGDTGPFVREYQELLNAQS